MSFTGPTPIDSSLLTFLAVLVGVLGVIAVAVVLLVRRLKRRMEAQAAAAPLSEKSRQGRGVAVIVFAVFALLGLGLLFPLGILPALRAWQARSWVEIPCTVVSSHVHENRDSDGSTYRPVIVYEYRFEGRTYTSDRYNFVGGSSSGRTGKQAVVDAHPPGAERRCFVNPRDPAQAVLVRGFSGEMLFGLIPLVFALIGIGGLVGTLRKRREAPGSPGAWEASGNGRPSAAGVDDDARELRVAQSRTAKVVGALLVALFWNGISWTLMVLAWRDREWVGVLFLTLFVLIGAGLVAAVIYLLLAWGNPQPRLMLRPGRLRRGVLQSLTWQVQGRVARLSRLQITLEGRESATYARGTRSVTDRSTCVRVVLAEVTGLHEIADGETSFELPETVVPGFAATNNKLEWFVRVRGDIARWPDVDEEFPVEIAPVTADPGAARAAAAAAEPMARSADGSVALGTEGGRVAYAPGETLQGVAGWQLPEAPRRVEVRLLWYTQGKGTRDVQVVATLPLEQPAPQEARAFALALPGAPWSTDGRLVSLCWTLELVVEPGSRNVRRDLVISPTGQPCPLPKVAVEDPTAPFWRRWGAGKP